MISDNVFTGISSNSPEEAPQALVKWTRVPPILNQAVSDGVTCALVMRTNGSLLSVAGDDAKIEKIIGGIVSSIWNSFQEEINACLASEQKMMLTTCKNGSFCMCSIGKFLLVLYSESSISPGLLIAKTKSLAAQLHQPLCQIYASTAY